MAEQGFRGPDFSKYFRYVRVTSDDNGDWLKFISTLKLEPARELYTNTENIFINPAEKYAIMTQDQFERCSTAGLSIKSEDIDAGDVDRLRFEFVQKNSIND